MINIPQVAVGALVVATFLVGYGVNEENRARRAEVDALKDRRAQLQVDIALLETEWSYLNSPAALDAITARLAPEDRLRLTPAGPDRLASLRGLPVRAADARPVFGEPVGPGFAHGETLRTAPAESFDAALAFRSGDAAPALAGAGWGAQ